MTYISIPVPSASSYPTIVLLISFGVCLLLSWRTWVSNRRNPVNIYYAVTMLMLAFWSLSTLGIRLMNTPFSISWAVRLSFFFGALIIFFFYLFTYYFPHKTFTLSKRSVILLLSSTAFILFISTLPNVLVGGFVSPGHRFDSENFLWNIVFTFYFITLLFLSYRNLFLKYTQSDGIWRKRLREIMIATSAPLLVGVFLALIMPIFYTNRFEWITALPILFMAMYIWYHIFWKSHRVPKH